MKSTRGGKEKSETESRERKLLPFNGKHCSSEASCFRTRVQFFSFSCHPLCHYSVSAHTVNTSACFCVCACTVSWTACSSAGTASTEVLKQTVSWHTSSSFPFHAPLSISIVRLPTVWARFLFLCVCCSVSWTPCCSAWTASAEAAKQAVLWCASSSFPFCAPLSVTVVCPPTVWTQGLFLCVCSVSWTLFCNAWATPGRCWNGVWMTATSWTSTPPPAAWRAVLSRVGLLQLSWIINVYGVCVPGLVVLFFFFF